MDCEHQNPNPKPNPSSNSNSNPKNIYHIGGIQVEFPYKPYGSQLAFMGRVISTLDKGVRQGHSHALLESPTGTGKSLSLLCSALAWQQNSRSKNLYANLSHTKSKPDPEAASDPLGHGGGFVPEPSGNVASEKSDPAPSTKNSGKQKKRGVPTIFFASRTHSQISQAVREYRKTSYRVPMAVLASRKHYCTNSNVCGKENVDEKCKLLLEDRVSGCQEFKNVHKVKGHPSLQKGGSHEAHDIEDLLKIGKVVKGCSYFAARTMAEEAQLVFCPYSYIVSPTIRRAMEIDLTDSIVILDEAHNIEDIARDVGSVDVDEDTLIILQKELGQLCFVDETIYQPLYGMIEGIISWMDQRKNTLVKREFQHYFSCWTGDKALTELQEANVSQQLYPILQECATKAIKAASDTESGSAHLSGLSVIALEGMFSSLGYFFLGNGLHFLDYNLVLQRFIKRNAGRESQLKLEYGSSNTPRIKPKVEQGYTSDEWTYSLGLWCMNPAVIFKEIAERSMSVILASGTLSPMGSFSSELGVKFETCMEAPHVIDVESQLWAAAISTGPGNYPLNASYRTADCYDFQDALGASIEEICKIVPGGALVFFPSYKLMEKLSTRWHGTGQWCRLNAQKSVFTEPKGQEDFELVLKDYYDSIRTGSAPNTSKIRRGRKRDLKNDHVKEETMPPSGKGGSAFLAVCRGKVSEGIDFSDENARVVIIVGIPFPNVNDIQVAQKKKFNDTFKSSKNLLSGSEWYCQQAFRALNQAAGRCIRHRFDYGAIILIDERFKDERNIGYISKWLKKSIKRYSSFNTSMEGLRSFFNDAKGRTEPTSVDILKDLSIEEESKPFSKPKMMSRGPRNRKRRNQRTAELNHPSGQKLLSEDSWSTSSISKITGGVTLPKLESEQDTGKQTECMDIKCSPKIVSRFSETISMVYSIDSSPEFVVINSPEFVVKETPGMHDNRAMASSEVISNNEISGSTIVNASNELFSPHFMHSSPLTKSNGPHSRGTLVSTATPERTNADTSNPKPEMEISFNSSVNSCTQKKRKPMSFTIGDISQMELNGNLDAESPNVDCMRTISSCRDAACSSKADCNECDNKNLSVAPVLMDKKLNICCSLCRSSLGLPDNHFLVPCSLTSSSKDYLVSFLKSRSQDPSKNESESIPVVISDIIYIDRRVYRRACSGFTAEHDVWCEKEGCVFRTVFCPFCSSSDHFLGLQILATDAPNVHLLNKIFFYFGRLDIKSLEASTDEALLPLSKPDVGETVSGSDLAHTLMDRFSYVPKQETSGGWRATKSKLRLPKKRGLFS